MKYRKKPVEIEAFNYNGDITDKEGKHNIPDWALKAFESGELVFDNSNEPGALYVRTLEGDMLVNVGDYIVQGIHEELYAVKPEIFKRTYEEVDAPRIVYARWYPDGGVEVYDLEGLKAEFKGMTEEEFEKYYKYVTDAAVINVGYPYHGLSDYDIEEIWREVNK